MKALSVKQPWAELIASGRKTIEVRSWGTGHRGPLLIVASLNADPDAVAWADNWFNTDSAARGVAVCVVDVLEVELCRKKGYLPEACCEVVRGDRLWVLTNARRVAPVPIAGRLMLYDAIDL